MSDQIIVFKNNLPNLTVLKLFSQDIDLVREKLQQKLKQAPMMFIGMQLLIDLCAFDEESELVLDVDALLVFLRGEGVNPMAFMSNRPSFREVLIKTKLGAMPLLENTLPELKNKGKISEKRQKPVVAEEPRKTFDDAAGNTSSNQHNQILRQPVRSGQRIYVQGDLTIIGTVSPGAEVIADGSIHVYGKLSGRAIAGAKGDEKAAIFCQKLDAELVSIAGNYKQMEDIDEAYLQQRVQISLSDEKILFSPL